MFLRQQRHDFTHFPAPVLQVEGVGIQVRPVRGQHVGQHHEGDRFAVDQRTVAVEQDALNHVGGFLRSVSSGLIGALDLRMRLWERTGQTTLPI